MVFECSGVPRAFPEGVRMTRDGGTYVVVGQFMDAGPADFHPFWITFKHVTIKGSYSFEPRHTLRGVRLLARTRNRYKFEEMIPTSSHWKERLRLWMPYTDGMWERLFLHLGRHFSLMPQEMLL